MKIVPPGENLDATFGRASPGHESDGDGIVFVGDGPHDHHWVTDRIAVGGGVWTREHVLGLRDEGVTNVIDCRSEFDAETIYRDTGVELFRCRTDDDGRPKDSAWFARGVTYAQSVLQNPASKLLVHCSHGIQRGPSMAYAILRALGWTRAGAESEIRIARPIARIRYAKDAERFIEGR